ncbi:hypothetical protein BXA06_08005 [Campylobacter lari]|nr:hypothetical protein [Campylobacter lari]
MEGKDWKNYANYCIDGLGCTSMIVGIGSAEVFNKTFDGQGFTLKNINIDTTSNTVGYKPEYVGIFGYIDGGAILKNINVDYMGGEIKATNTSGDIRAGGFAGYGIGEFSNIFLKNIGNISVSGRNDKYASVGGGFVGSGGGSFTNISLNNIGNISVSGYATNGGGFGGRFTGDYFGNNHKTIFTNISLNNIGNISVSGSSSTAGGFIAFGLGGAFTNISLNGIGNISASGSSSTAGGFMGRITALNETVFNNISLNNIGDISANANDNINETEAGGFAGNISAGRDEITLTNISLNNIGNISANNLGRVSYAGGFAGNGSGGTFNNISLNNIGNISANANATAYTGGFAGSDNGGTFTNISLNNIGNISASGVGASAGGILGLSLGGTFTNISLNNIGNISASANGSDLISSSAWAGGFVGQISVLSEATFTNISLNNIGNISASAFNSSDATAYAGGFVGKTNGGTFKNIYMYFNPNMKIEATATNNTFNGIFYGAIDNPNIALSNIHIYHKKGELSNSTADQSHWGNTNDKIQIHTYTDDKQGYLDFEKAVLAALAKDGLHKDKDGNLIFTTDFEVEKPTDPADPTDPDVILGSDDLYTDVIIEWIINEIRGVEHTINIEDLKKLADFINAFKGLDKESSEDEIKAIVKVHLGIKDNDKALSIAQSISFLLNYKEYNFDKKLNDEALAVYNNIIKPNVNNTLGIISYLDKNQAYLLEQYNKYKELEQIFKDKELAYFKAEAEFNRLLDLINKGELSYKDPKFTQAFDNWTKAYNAYNALSNDISDLNNNVASVSNGIKDLGYTKFSFTKFDDITKIDLVKPEFPDIDNSQGGDLPTFEQTASLNLIGDETINEEEEQEEIDETSLIQKGKTCIVSDNYKTMNPCIVGGL